MRPPYSSMSCTHTAAAAAAATGGAVRGPRRWRVKFRIRSALFIKVTLVARANTEVALQVLTNPINNDKLLGVRNYAGDRTGYLAIDGRNSDMSFINDCHPEEDNLNVIFTPGGYVRAVADIKSGSELLTNYGDAYREKYLKKKL